MTIERLRETLTTEPFAPFTILTTDGREFPVKSPEFVLIAPKASRTFVVASAPEHYTVLDLLLVVGLEYGNGKHPRRKAG